MVEGEGLIYASPDCDRRGKILDDMATRERMNRKQIKALKMVPCKIVETDTSIMINLLESDI